MPDVDPQRAIAAKPMPTAEDPDSIDALLDGEEAPAESHGIGHRLALFAYRGQLGPTIREELQDFLIKRRR